MTQLVLALPRTWRLLDDAVAEGVSAAVVEYERTSRPTGVSDPLLYATMLAAVVDDDEVEDVLMAGLVVTSIPTAQVEQVVTTAERELRVLRDVEVTAGVAADFGVITILAPHGDVTALLTFGTPNLPKLPEMLDGFRAIAATARLEDAS